MSDTTAPNTDTVAIPADVKGRKTLAEQGKTLIDATTPAIEGKGAKTAPAPAPAPAQDNPAPLREELLNDASDKITVSKEEEYGNPIASFERIAALWTAREMHLSNMVYTASDVAQMLALLQVSRLARDPEHGDSWVDLIGYAALGGEVSL